LWSVWRAWRKRQYEYARVALHESADRPFEYADTPDRAGDSGTERLLETPTTARSIARVAAERLATLGSGGVADGRRWLAGAKVIDADDVQATQALIRETLDAEDEEAAGPGGASGGRPAARAARDAG